MKNLQTPIRIFLHHTGLRTSDIPEQFDRIKKSHINKGWGDIGYHGLIERNGVHIPGRDMKYQGAHTYGQNENSIGICLAGNFDIDLPSAAQMNTLVRILRVIRFKYGDLPLLLHRDYRNTHCPGTRLTVDYLLGQGIKIADKALLRRFEGFWVQRPESHGEIYKVVNGRLLYLHASPGPLFDDLSRYLKKEKKLTGLSEKNWDKIKAALIK